MERVKFAANAQDGVEIAYSVVGGGAPLLLLHGSMTSAAVWQALGYVDALRDEHQLVLVDARGHGRSEKPTTTDAYAMERLVGDVLAVLDDCGLAQTAYLGYSLGGRVGFALAIQAPERLRALIFGGASHRPQTGALDRLFFPCFVDMIEMEGIEAALERWSERVGRAIDPAVRQVLLGNDSRALVPYLRQVDREPGVDESALSRVQQPVLLFAGERDHERLSDSRAAASILPDAELLVIPTAITNRLSPKSMSSYRACRRSSTAQDGHQESLSSDILERWHTPAISRLTAAAGTVRLGRHGFGAIRVGPG